MLAFPDSRRRPIGQAANAFAVPGACAVENRLAVATFASASRSFRKARICQSAQRALARGHRLRAFTLIEVIVVLALLSLLGAIVVPNLGALVGSFGRATERAVILDQVAGLGERALLDGTGYVVTGSDADDDEPPPARFTHYPTLRLDAPEGWRIVVAPPVIVHANGVCMGGQVRLGESAGAQETVELRAPHCRVTRGTDDATGLAGSPA